MISYAALPILLIALILTIIKLSYRYGNSQRKKWMDWATQIGMNPIPKEKKGLIARMKEYERDIKNPHIRRRKEKIMTGSAKGAEITGYFVFEMKRVGTKERIQPVRFELDFVDKQKNYTELIIEKKKWIGTLFFNIPKGLKVELPPQLSDTFIAMSARPERIGKVITQIASLLTKDMKDLVIYMTSNTISLKMKRSKVNYERLMTMKKIGRKLLETGEEFAV